MTRPLGSPQRVVFGETLVELADGDRRIVVLDGDLGNSTRADIFEQAHPDRFFQMGIAEQNMLGVAAGMATVGFVPFISSFACFVVARALDQIRVLVAQPGLNVKIIGSYSGLLTARTGKTHMIFNDLAIMRTMTGLVVVSPVDEIEARLAMRAIAAHDGPVYMRLCREASPRVFDSSYRFHLGKATVLRQGSDVTLIATGVQTARVLEAADLLGREGVQAHVVHVPTIKPLDEKTILEAADRTGLVVTVEEHYEAGGLGGAIAEVLCERRPLPLKRIGIAEAWGESGPDDALLDSAGLSAQRDAATVRRFLREMGR